MTASTGRRMASFRRAVWRYYAGHRRDLPWRRARNPYRILVSEIMLQQTQVTRVAEKYGPFLREFPDLRALARADTRRLLSAWQGLGYNRRALFLRAAAHAIIAAHGGRLPDDPLVLRTLPGIGPGTAGAIAAFAYNRPVVFLETNIRRVFLHRFFPARTRVPDARLYPLIEQSLDRARPREWYYALMDYGAMLAGKLENPNRRSRHYITQSRFEGSDRQLRGRILRQLLAEEQASVGSLATALREEPRRVDQTVRRLVRDGFLTRQRGRVSIT